MIAKEKIIEAIKQFVTLNSGDKATEYILICLGADIIGISVDEFATKIDYNLN